MSPDEHVQGSKGLWKDSIPLDEVSEACRDGRIFALIDGSKLESLNGKLYLEDLANRSCGLY